MAIFGRFRKDERGATAVLFGLAVIPLMAAMGAAVDYSRAANVRTSLQKAVDAAAISLARDANTLKRRDLEERGREMFAANFVPSAEAAINPVSVRREGKTIRVAAQGTVGNAFMPLFGFERTAIAAEAVVGWGARKLEIALVLDNTGSMREPLGRGSTKMAELKRAARDLLDDAERASQEPGDIKIAIIPFDTQVNVGAHLSPLSASFEFGVSQRQWTSKPDRCIMDRDRSGDYDINDELAQTGLAGTLFPAVACAGDLASLEPLTGRFGELRDTVRTMAPSGCTNITIGTTWGLKSLSDTAPLGEAAAFGAADVEKYMIVLTDGANTQNRWVNDCTAKGDVKRIDERTLGACSLAKGKGVRLYTVLVGAGNAPLLTECAGNGGSFTQVNDAAAISAVFKTLLADILAPRLTQ